MYNVYTYTLYTLMCRSGFLVSNDTMPRRFAALVSFSLSKVVDDLSSLFCIVDFKCFLLSSRLMIFFPVQKTPKKNKLKKKTAK